MLTGDKVAIVTDRAPAAVGPYSQAIKAGGFIFCSGQIPLDPKSGQVVGADVAAQTDRVLQNLEAVLSATGSGLYQVVKTTVYLKNMGDFAAMNAVYEKHFQIVPPARATVEVARLPKDVLVEIDCIAYAPAKEVPATPGLNF
ncbi:MAG: RidA family protein [Candidatus Sumerlaeaceae bacterium]|nr:RidA family protein [Candidatus Sumerlaeaceae bacterium]